MNEWKVADAKSHFSAMLQEAGTEPQVICRREQPIAVVMSMAAYSKSTGTDGSTIAQTLAQLQLILQAETAELEIPPRTDRPLPPMED